MKAVETILKVFFFAALLITGLFNIFGGIAMMSASGLNMGFSVSILIITAAGLIASFILAITRKWKLTLIVSASTAITVSALAYYLVVKGFNINLYIRNHTSILLVPIFALFIFIIRRHTEEKN